MSGSRKLFWNKFHVVGPATAKVRRRTYRAETVEPRADGGWRNEDAVVQQLERPVYTAQIDNPVPGHASTFTPSPKLVCDSICHIEPMQLRVKQVCQAAVVLLRAAHNSSCSVHDPLQLVGNRLWCSGQQQIAWFVVVSCDQLSCEKVSQVVGYSYIMHIH